MKHVGKNIKSLRQKQGWNQEYVARKLKISIPALSKIETSVTDINLSRLAEIAVVFNVNIAEILDLPGQSISAIHDNEIKRYKDLLDDKDAEIFKLQRRVIDLFDEIRAK